MNTIVNVSDDGRRRRRRHTPEFKARVVAACCKPGMSMASVALANGVNANLVRRWVVDSETAGDRLRRAPPDSTKRLLSAPASFVPLPLPNPTPASPTSAEIRIEVTRGTTTIAVTWPTAAASECAAWMRELLR